MVEPMEGEPEEDDWVPIHGAPEPSRDVPTAPTAPSRYLSEHIAQVSCADRITGEHAQSSVSAALYHPQSPPSPAPSAIVYFWTFTGDNAEAPSRRRAHLQALLR
jgi:hypothetical protein